MKFESFYSSSKSNLYVVTAANGKRILIECGCTWKKLRQALKSDLSNVVGCLLTHEHADHSKAVEDVMEYGIDVYAPSLTIDRLLCFPDQRSIPKRAYMIWDRTSFKIARTFRVFPFTLWADDEKNAYAHDVPIFGYIIFDMPQDECMLFVTDASHIIARFALQFNIIALCCNYDGEILHALEKADKINTDLAKRLLTSHMEYRETRRYIAEFCNTDKCTEIHLLHVSPSNIDAEKVRSEFERDFMIKTLVAGRRRDHFSPSRT